MITKERCIDKSRVRHLYALQTNKLAEQRRDDKIAAHTGIRYVFYGRTA